MMDEPEDNPMGRKSTYTPELGEKIIEMTAEGLSQDEIARHPGMPPQRTISNWGMNPKHSDQDFVAGYARAREAGAHAQFEQIRRIEEKLLAEKFEDPQNARIALDAIKWRLSKMLPGVYGDRSHIEHSGSVKVDSVRAFAPEWMAERLSPPPKKADELDEAGTVH